MKLLLFGQRCIESGLSWLFAPLSWLYAFVVSLRNWAYDHAFLPVSSVNCTVVSVGNIAAGGTGKTPFIHLLANAFPSRKVAILSRGYGPMPDEALLLAKRLPQCRIYVGKDRVLLAKQAAQEADLILLDDGFQHRRLARDIDIVLTDSKKQRYLPWGFLRDSPKRLQKADEVFSLEKELRLQVKRILDLKGNSIPSIAGWEVFLFSGIAHPERFKKTVIDLGAQVIGEKRFADHGLADLSKLPNAKAFVCTEKDAVKLLPTHLPVFFLEMEMQFVGPIARWEKLIEKIDQKIDNRRTYER